MTHLHPVDQLQRSSDPIPMNSGFLCLPLELRIEIYRHILVHRDPVGPISANLRVVPNTTLTGLPSGVALEFYGGNSGGNNLDIVRATVFKPGIGVLLVCRQVSQEALPVLYGCNHFALYAVFLGNTHSDTDTGSIMDFLLRIGTANRRSIRRLTIDWTFEMETGWTHEGRRTITLRRGPFLFPTQLITDTTHKKISLVLDLLASERSNRRGFDHLTCNLPGVSSAARPQLLYSFEANSFFRARAELRKKLSGIGVAGHLVIGFTTALDEAEQCALEMGANTLTCFWAFGNYFTVNQTVGVKRLMQNADRLEDTGWKINRMQGWGMKILHQRAQQS